MVDLPPGFRVKAQPQAAPAQSTPAIPEGFRVKGAPPVDPNAGWQEPGMIVPVQFKEGTGEMRWAVPKLVTDTINAISAPGKAWRGEYGMEVDPETGRPTTITNDMISDTMGLAGLVGLEPAAQAGAQFGKGLIKPGATKMVQRELAHAGIDPAQVPSIMRSMGPQTVVADLSPGLQARAAAIATMPGSGQKSIVDALAARRAGANVRIQTGVDDVLGPTTSPRVFQAGIKEQQRALSPVYEAAFENAKAVDTSNIALDLDSLAVNSRGEAQQAAKTVRGLLNVYGTDDVLDPNPRTLFEVRRAIDGMMGSTQDNNVRRVLGDTRKKVDDLLAVAVPGIKDADAQYSSLARQGEAFDDGMTVLDNGRTGLWPGDVASVFDGMKPEIAGAFSQGARAEIDRIIGPNSNDITALKRILQGEGNWNRDRLKTVFGEDKAKKLLDIFEQEALQHATEEMALRGSRTDVLRSAKVDIEGGGAKSPNPLRSLLDFKPGTAASDLWDNGFGWLSAEKRASTNSQVAQALMARADDVPMMQTIGRPMTDGRKVVNLALLRAMALGNEGYAENAGMPYRALTGR